LSVRSIAGGTLAKFETNPRKIQPVTSAGDQFVDCCIESLPLLPGQYFISVGLAHYGVEIIDWKMDIGTVIVAESGGQALEMSAFPDGPLVVRHRWDTNPALQRVVGGE